ncbi:MAG: Rieske (2Fe-2S) protein [Desulfurococcales archaeon]|nr:Rieske (2Fe-2S) protein [Desulfurococcales archaeon]
MERRISVLRSHMLPEGSVAVKIVGGVPLLLARSNGPVYAYVAVCPHRYYILCPRKVEDGLLECPGHGERFKVDTGEPTRGLAGKPLTRVKVLESEGRIYIEADLEDLASKIARETSK